MLTLLINESNPLDGLFANSTTGGVGTVPDITVADAGQAVSVQSFTRAGGIITDSFVAGDVLHIGIGDGVNAPVCYVALSSASPATGTMPINTAGMVALFAATAANQLSLTLAVVRTRGAYTNTIFSAPIVIRRSAINISTAVPTPSILGTGVAAALQVAINTALGFVRLDASARLPAVDGSQLTNLPNTGGVTSITGTANEITVTGTTTPTLSLPSALTFTGKTITGGTFASPSLTTPTIGDGTEAAPSLSFTSDTNTGLYRPTADTVGIVGGGHDILRLTDVASATDYLEIKNGIGVGSPLHVLAEGASANIGVHLQPKGSGLFTISDGTDFNKGIRFRSSSSAASAITLLDAVSTAGRVVTLPDATGTLALVSGDLGTPSALVGTNITGTAASLTAGTVTTNANLTGHVTSTGNAAVLGSFTFAQLNTAVSDADLARTSSTNTFTGVQSLTSPDITTSITTPSTSFTAFAGATTLMTLGGTGASASTFFPSTLDATSSITGAIRTSGGISAAKAANFGTTIRGGSSLTLGAAGGTVGSVVLNGSTTSAATITVSADGTLAMPSGTYNSITSNSTMSAATVIAQNQTTAAIGIDISSLNSGTQVTAGHPWMRVGGGASEYLMINAGLTGGYVDFCQDLGSGVRVCDGTGGHRAYLTAPATGTLRVTTDGSTLGTVDAATFTGNAATATKWTTGRTIALTGDVTYTSGALDGSGNVTGTATLANIPAISGANLTTLNASNVSSGTLAAARMANAGVHTGDATGTFPAITLNAAQTGITSVGTLTGGATGAGFTVALDTSTITGTLADARLSANVPLKDAANTFTAENINSKSGAASVTAMKFTGVPFAGTGTTSFPLVYINDANATASTTLNTAGTYLGVNGDGTQDLMNLMKDGVSKMSLSNEGIVAITSSKSVSNSVTQALLYVKNTLATSNGQVGLSLDKGASNATAAFNFLTAGTAQWDCGISDDNNFHVRDAVNAYAKVFNITQGAGANALNIGASGAVTMAGTLAVTGATTLTGNLTSNGALISTPQALTGAGAVNVTTLTTAVTTTAPAQALTLANGTNGQIKTIVHQALSGGGTWVLTPTTKTGYTTITSTAVGETCTLQFFTTIGWCILSLRGAIAA